METRCHPLLMLARRAASRRVRGRAARSPDSRRMLTEPPRARPELDLCPREAEFVDPLLLNDEVLELRDIVFVELMRDIVPSSARRALRKLPSTRTCMTGGASASGVGRSGASRSMAGVMSDRRVLDAATSSNARTGNPCQATRHIGRLHLVPPLQKLEDDWRDEIGCERCSFGILIHRSNLGLVPGAAST